MRAPPLPYPLSLDDPGASWARDASGLALVRRPTPRALLVPGSVAVVLAAASALSREAGASALSIAFAVGVPIALGWLAVTATHRATLRASRERVSWDHRGLRRGSGSFARASLAGVRLVLVRRPVRGMWGTHGVQLRVDGAWVLIAAGRSQEQAGALARDLAQALDLPLEETTTWSSLSLLRDRPRR